MSSYVSQIQTKLKAGGYYHGDIDGIAFLSRLCGGEVIVRVAAD